MFTNSSMLVGTFKYFLNYFCYTVHKRKDNPRASTLFSFVQIIPKVFTRFVNSVILCILCMLSLKPVIQFVIDIKV